MKKKLIISILCLLCFGCGKTEKNITINIYDNRNSETEVSKEELNENDLQPNETINNYTIVNDASNEKVNTDKQDTTLDKIKGKANSTYDSAKTWYDNNKDELKATNKEILEDDKETITEFWNKTKTWYDDNKDDIKSTAKEKYSDGKSTIKSIIDKINE